MRSSGRVELLILALIFPLMTCLPRQETNNTEFHIPLHDPEPQEDVKPGPPLTKEEFEKAARMPVAKAPDKDKMFGDPLEVPGAFEGDITGVNVSQLFVRNAILHLQQKWPHGIVPYLISSEYNKNERLRIAQAILEYHTRTCVRFVPRTNQNDYIFIGRGRGCTSMVGRKGGRQFVSLGFGCVYQGIIIHELMHVVGFWHEQSRADRDNYVVINWNNIVRGMEFNFLKFTWREIQALGEPYDLKSVMHYGPYSFSKDGRSPTIVARVNVKIGQRDGFSAIDLRKVNKLYECNEISKPPPSTKCSDQNNNCRRWAQQGECGKNPLWMRTNCRLSCGSCDELKSCKDQNSMCSRWAELWQCQANPAYMKSFCRKSCKICR